MAAFLEGKLAPGEVAEVAAHLRDCAECRTVAGEAARFEVEEEEKDRALPTEPRTMRRAKWWAAAAVAAAAAATPLLLRPPAPIATLIEASPRDYRRVQGRLSDFPWAEVRGRVRGAAQSREELRLASAANDVLERTIDDEAVEARHAAGVAHLLIDQNVRGLEKLRSAAGDSKDPDVWNDLAVAELTVAVGEERTARLSSALASVDRALKLDPKLAAASFNRALILEELGLPDAARNEWRRYLALDPSSEWSIEARQHLDKLSKPQSRLNFKDELARAAGNREAIASLVRRFPQESRLTGEGLLMAAWARAYLANDAARAEAALTQTRAIAEALASVNGERLLLDTVHGIERMDDLRAFALACVTYHEADLARQAKSLTVAEDGLRRAAAAFGAAGSPFADAAAFYLAQIAFDTNRVAESNAALHALRARIPPSYLALSAEIDGCIARNAIAGADWGTAREFASRARETFASLGETKNTARPTGIEVFALEKMGALDIAWRCRLQSLAAAADKPATVAAILHSAAVALASKDQIDAASAIMDVSIETDRLVEDPFRATYLTERARLAARTGDLDAARRCITEARSALANVKEARLREGPEAQIDLTEAIVLRASDPIAALAQLDETIAFFEKTGGYALRLPEAYLQRARTNRVLQRTEAALADYTAALRRLDAQQKTAGRQALSLEVTDPATETVEETVDLLLERGEVARAFEVADRAKSGRTADDYRMAAVPEGTAVVEYLLLPRSLVIFCATRNGIVAKRVGVERAALETRVSSFVRKMQLRQELARDAASLHGLLIQPVASHIAGARELVIVPDRKLSELPFAALHDGKRYLIETHVLCVAPSAAASARGRGEIRPVQKAVVIADPATERAPLLQFSRNEAETIAAIYGGTTIVGRSATRARVSAAIASSEIVHYAGHANSDLASYGALLLAPDGDESDLLTAADVARLDLRARPLIVLAACGTLRGETTHIAGMPSLARAFLGAGASAVVGTLWEVEDDLASELFYQFHERVGDGVVPAAALQAAQLAMLQTPELRRRHPASWAAVEVLTNL